MRCNVLRLWEAELVLAHKGDALFKAERIIPAELLAAGSIARSNFDNAELIHDSRRFKNSGSTAALSPYPPLQPQSFSRLFSVVIVLRRTDFVNTETLCSESQRPQGGADVWALPLLPPVS